MLEVCSVCKEFWRAIQFFADQKFNKIVLELRLFTYILYHVIYIYNTKTCAFDKRFIS